MLRCRIAFTLIEVLVAVVLIDVGLLALVAASAVLVRQTTEIHARAAALHMANDRVQALASGPCVAVAGNADDGSAAATRERWSVVLQPNHTREVRDSVTFFAAGIAKSVAIATRLTC